MPEHQLQMLKIFVINRVVPKCKLKEICETLQICFKLTSVNSSDRTVTETIGDKKTNVIILDYYANIILLLRKQTTHHIVY